MVEHLALPKPRIPIIIDTDPGVDDVIAILLALASPELEILAFIVSFGNTDLDSSYMNILKVYHALSRHFELHPEDSVRFPNYFNSKPVLVQGASGPLEGDLHSAQYFHGRDGLSDISTRHPDLSLASSSLPITSHPQLQLTHEPATTVILTVLNARPQRTVTYVALGPLTNLALVMSDGGDTLRERIGRIVCMGGALDVPGNTSPVSEFNFFADPHAVHSLLIPSPSSPTLPLDRFLLLPLDITTPHELSFDLYKSAVDPFFDSTSHPSRAEDKEPLIHFTSSFLERTKEIMREFGCTWMELHDIVAIWCAIENPPMTDVAEDRLGNGWRTVRRRFQIERKGELTRGMLVVDRRDDQGAYVPGSNRAEVHADVENVRGSGAPFESPPTMVEVEPPIRNLRGAGVLCVVETPGPKMLVDMLLKRVWGKEF